MSNGPVTPPSTPGVQECQNIQILEPDATLPVATGAAPDPAFQERGEVVLTQGQSEVSVTFQTPKAGDYRFEYLYVDAFGVTNPGTIKPVPITQTTAGFTVDLAGVPPVAGYILRWRVTVVLVGVTPQVDTPESFRVQIPTPFPEGLPIPVPPQFYTLSVTFQNPRSSNTYGFSELRVENLVDDPGTQTPIAIQVCAKTTTNFTIVFNPTPPTANYFLVGRTP